MHPWSDGHLASIAQCERTGGVAGHSIVTSFEGENEARDGAVVVSSRGAACGVEQVIHIDGADADFCIAHHLYQGHQCDAGLMGGAVLGCSGGGDDGCTCADCSDVATGIYRSHAGVAALEIARSAVSTVQVDGSRLVGDGIARAVLGVGAVEYVEYGLGIGQCTDGTCGIQHFDATDVADDGARRYSHAPCGTHIECHHAAALAGHVHVVVAFSRICYVEYSLTVAAIPVDDDGLACLYIRYENLGSTYG